MLIPELNCALYVDEFDRERKEQEEQGGNCHDGTRVTAPLFA